MSSNSSGDTIPLVDLSSSQEDEFEVAKSQKRKENEVVQIVDSPNIKKPRLSDGIPSNAKQTPPESRNDLVAINQRLSDLEKFLTQAPFQATQKGQYVTREEFEELLGRVSRIEERIDKVEQIFGSIKSAFVEAGPLQMSRATTASSVEKQARASPEKDGAVPVQTAKSNTNIVTAATGNSKPTAIDSTTPGASKPPSNVSAVSRNSKPTKSNTNIVTAATGNSKPTAIDSTTPGASKPPSNVSAVSRNSKPTANVSAQQIVSPKIPTPKSSGVKSLNTENVHVTPGPSTSGTHTLRTGAEDSAVNTTFIPALSSTDLTVSSNVRPVMMTATNNVHKVSPGTANSKRSQTSTIPGRSSVSPSTSQSKTSPAPLNIRNLSSGITVTPVPNNRHSVQNAQPSSSVSTSGRDHQTPNAHISSEALRKSLSQILSEPPPNQNDLNMLQGQEELPEGIIGNIRVKQELYDSYPLEKVDTACFRKERDNNKEYVLIYIEGGGRKVRNQNIYAAIGQLSLSDTWTRVLPFLSSLDSTKPHKQIRTIQAEAEIIAALFALEDVKRNSTESSPLRVTIVTKCDKLKTIMSAPKTCYFNLLICDCTAFPCGHLDRWITFDTFALTFSDDLPRLVLATRRVEVKWRTYANERQDRQVQEFFKQKLQTEIKTLLKVAK